MKEFHKTDSLHNKFAINNYAKWEISSSHAKLGVCIMQNKSCHLTRTRQLKTECNMCTSTCVWHGIKKDIYWIKLYDDDRVKPVQEVRGGEGKNWFGWWVWSTSCCFSGTSNAVISDTFLIHLRWFSYK